MHKVICLRIIVGVVLLLFAVKGNAQLKSKIERYSTEDGLSHDNVTQILKDRDGFMWFATWDGINRFDGHNFITYKSYPGDNSTLKNNRIVNIVEDNAGYLWLKAYDRQIYRFDKRTQTFFALADVLGKQGYQDIVFDRIILGKNNCIWLTTSNTGVFCVRKSTSSRPEISLYAKGQAIGHQLASNHIRFLYPDQANTIWIGTPQGLSRLTPGNAGAYKSEVVRAAGLNNLDFTSIAEGKDKVWFGTAAGYLVVYDRKTNRFTKHKVSENSINALSLSKKRNVLYLTSPQRQLITFRIADNKTEVASMPGKGAFLSVYEDNTGLVWIEPGDDGAIKFDPGSQKFKLFTQPKDASFHASLRVYNIFEDHQNRVWLCLQGGGFGYYDPAADSLQFFYNKPGSADQKFSNLVHSRYVDPTGVLWIGTNDRGINKIIFHENYFGNKILVPGTARKTENEIRAVLQDSRNRTWFATKAAKLFVHENGKTLTDLFDDKPDFGSGVYCMLEDRNKNIWLGTKGKGLYKAIPVNKDLTKYRLTHYLPDANDPYSISSDQVYTLLEDSRGRIWLGTYGGGINLIESSENTARFYNEKNKLQHKLQGFFGKIRHLNEGPDGKIWAGTTDGLLIINPNLDKGFSFKTYQKVAGDKMSLGNNDVQFLLKDSKHTMWVCTSGGGLNKAIISGKDHLKFQVFTKEHGLPNDYILSALEDNSGNIWLATEKGISKFEKDRYRFTNYDSYDGLPKSSFSENSAIKLSNGNLVFGTRNGYLTFNPAAIKNQKVSANMALTNLQVNNKEVEPTDLNALLQYNISHTDAVTLAYNQNTIGLEFTVLDYHADNKQAYAYRLLGFDEKWQHVKSQQKAIYTNLPPGNYTFEVKSLNTDVYETIPYKKLAITIHPPLWRTTWAYLLYMILALMLLETVRRVAFSMIKLRNRIAVEQKLTDLKLRFFTNISHELRTPLTLIVNPIEAIAHQEALSPKGREYIQVVRKNTNRMVRFINQLLDFRKAQSGKMKLKIAPTEVVALVNEISSHFTEAASEKQILLQTISNVQELYAWLDAEKIDIVLYNLLSNALKFTPYGKIITVEINSTGEEAFTVKVIDQGPGVPKDKLSDIFELYYEVDTASTPHAGGTGIGLALAKEFVELHHGQIKAYNNATQGLTVTVALKTGKDHFGSEEVIAVEPPAKKAEATLPANKPTESKLTEAEPVAKDALPLVLLVEDNSELRRFLADQLSAFYRVEEAEDGKEGLIEALRLLPDLVISDIMMPKMDGIQLLDKLKNTEATSHIPVILLTAKTSVEQQIEGLNYGADYYITKPFQTEFILASVKNLLTQRKKVFEALLSGRKTVELCPGEIVITSKDEAFLKEVIQVVEEGMCDPEFNIDAVAETIGMGRSTFFKKFTSLTNMAPVEFVRDMRLQRGKQLFDAGESNISEIAYAIGFNSAGYFSTCFKKKYQLSPSEYLKNIKDHQL